MSTVTATLLDAAMVEARAGLEGAARRLADEGLPAPALRGKLLRPLVAYLALERPDRADDGFWLGALAIQMVHEASLLHDDILDEAETRRGRPTVVASRGVGPALVLGDHLLTASYRAAARSGRPGFLRHFVDAVERTVAGEIRQGRATGERLSPAAYRDAIEGKSGELFAAALLLARPDASVDEVGGLGRRLGALYQMVDDYLDYCPDAGAGKPPLQDLRQRKWTFVLDAAGLESFPEPADPVAWSRGLFRPGSDAPSAMRRALARLEAEARRLAESGLPAGLSPLVDTWLDVARGALMDHEARGPRPLSRPAPEAEVVTLARQVGPREAWLEYFGRHGTSFRFASRLFAPGDRDRVTGMYAFCRFTDDLVDEAAVPAPRAAARLEAWRGLARQAYAGRRTGVPLADHVMGEMASRGIPFAYADELLTGVGMDLARVRYATEGDLRTYTHRVASVVGGWMTELAGVREPTVIERAYELGHAMQLTNILRDVGDDWRDGRLYLPAEVLARFDLDETHVERVAATGEVPDAWPEMIEYLMGRADGSYRRAFEAVPALPRSFARPVAVAARVYQGIHDEIRRNGYDNGTRRAYTTRWTKARLAWGSLRDLRRLTSDRWELPGRFVPTS